MEYNNSEILERVKQIQLSKSTSVAHFSRILDMRQVRVNNHLNGTSEISSEMLVKILNVFPDISAEWLMRGVGTMMLDESSAMAIEALSSSSLVNEELKSIREENEKIKDQIDTLYGILKRLTGQ